MDLEALWQEHKQFIVRVGIGAAVFAGLSFARDGIAKDTDRTAKANAAETTRLQADIAELEKEGLEKGRADKLLKNGDAILEFLGWTLAKDFVLPQDEKNLGIFASTAANRAAEAVSKRAAREGVKAPRNPEELGLRDAGAVGTDVAKTQEVLARADATTRLVLAAIDAGARKVEVRQGPATYDPRPGEGDKKAYLRQLVITIRFDGDSKVMAKVLDRFQEKGQFLELVGCRAKRGTDGPAAEEGRLDVTLDLQMISVVPETPSGYDPDRSKPSPTKGPKKPRRD